jgi:YfiH family protein
MTEDQALARRSADREAAVGDASVPRLELADWGHRFGLVAGITTRGHGFSLGLWSDDHVGQVMTRWRAFRTTFEVRFPTCVLSHQVHGDRVAWHDGGPEGWVILDGLDGHATATPGVLLTVTVADCIPVYLAVPRTGAVALVHAGWRGVAAGVLERGVDTLARHTSARSADIVMHCGVGICGACYEVGPEVVSAVTGGRAAGQDHVDLRALLAQQAQALGLAEVSRSPWCSAHDRERFFSHRASGGRDGRMVAYLGRPLA